MKSHLLAEQYAERWLFEKRLTVRQNYVNIILSNI